jgi:hypothetical protein
LSLTEIERSDESHLRLQIASIAASSAPPEIAGLLTAQLSGFARAYSRRAGVLTTGLTLRGLKAIDQKFDTMLEICRYYPAESLAEIATCFERASATERVGAAFVWITLAEQHNSEWPQRRLVILRFLAQYPIAVRDALWFYGASDTCRHLLNDAQIELRALGVELAGALIEPNNVGGVESAVAFGVNYDDCMLALVRVGRCPDTFEQRVREVLAGGHLVSQIKLLEALSICGKPVLQSELTNYLGRITAADGPNEQTHPQLWAQAVNLAFAIYSVRQPIQAADAVIKGLRVPSDVALRCIALCGRIEAILPTLALLEKQQTAFTATQRDVIYLIFGRVPAELTVTPGVQSDRVRALRDLACEVFSALGCGDISPASITDWNAPAVKALLWPLEQIRLRGGRVWKAGQDITAALEVSHAMRKWMYIEHASASPSRFALSSEDLAQRQWTVIENLRLIDELRIN